MHKLWQLLLTGRFESKMQDFNVFSWTDNFMLYGLTASLRLELCDVLTPKVLLRAHSKTIHFYEKAPESKHIKEIIDWKIVLSAKNVKSSLQNLPKGKQWNEAIAELLPEFCRLLRDALDIRRELEGADDKSDQSYIYQPLISEHQQNSDKQYDWTALIVLTRDAWLALADISPAQAARVAESWLDVPYPLFKRLAFFAASQPNIIPIDTAIDWLLMDEHWWLWSIETKNEVELLQDSIAMGRPNKMMQKKLDSAILAGQPHNML